MPSIPVPGPKPGPVKAGPPLTAAAGKGAARPDRTTPSAAIPKPRPARRRREWTTLVGLRRAVAFLVLRSVVCLPVLTAVLWFATFAWTAALPMVLAGVSLGAILGHRLNERSGLVGGAVTLLALIAAWVITLAAIVVTETYVNHDSVNQAFSAVALGAGATVVIVAMTFFDE